MGGHGLGTNLDWLIFLWELALTDLPIYTHFLWYLHMSRNYKDTYSHLYCINKINPIWIYVPRFEFTFQVTLVPSKSWQPNKCVSLINKSPVLWQWVFWAPLCITLKIKIWVVACLKFIIFFPSIKKKYFILCNFLVRTLQCWKKKKKKFAHKKLKKPP
jgi:hypothetical protein